jgi:hypothetical protein
MSSPHPATEGWAEWWRRLDSFRAALRKLSQRGTTNVKAAATRDEAKGAVQCYFREVRPQLVNLRIDERQIARIDAEMQGMIELATKVTRTTTYKASIRVLDELRAEVETAIEIKAAATDSPDTGRPTATEAEILDTLDRVVPTIALLYQQVLQDLRDPDRVSYRGTASELREALRELLDHLAPDAEVLRSGVRPEAGQTKPTMKQKAMFILKARGRNETQRKTAADAIEIVEGAVGALARSVYNRGSLSSHVSTTREEVLIFKGYAEAVLADLLEIHKN